LKVYGITGWKNSGKTGLVTRLVTHFASQGLKISTLKHAHHAFEIDHEGRDSFRHRQAGAQEVAVISAARMAVMTEFRGADEPSMEEVLARLAPADLVLIEGYKTGPQPKIEVRQEALGQPLMAAEIDGVRAIASDGVPQSDLPLLDLNDTAAIAAFILADLGIS